MAGRGPAPKSDEARSRANPPAVPWVDVGREPIKDAPTLGRRPGGGRWLAESRAYFETWRRMPWASMFEATDWTALRRATWLLDRMYRDDGPAVSLSAEIRQIEAKVGATVRDRQDLRLRVHRPAGVAEPDAQPDERPQLRRVAGDPRLKVVPRDG